LAIPFARKALAASPDISRMHAILPANLPDAVILNDGSRVDRKEKSSGSSGRGEITQLISRENVWRCAAPTCQSRRN
jgi:hypothetical protein